MPDDTLQIDVTAWVAKARHDPVAWRQRQAVEIVLNGIARLVPRHQLYLKGGLLMGLVYDSPRLTTDIDLSAGFPAKPGIASRVKAELDREIQAAAPDLGYADIEVRVHSISEKPHNLFDLARFPALKIKIAYSARTGAYARKQSKSYFDVDISFNESLCRVDILDIGGGQSLLAYSLVDLIAEKYRAVLQQTARYRNRRQDIYDLQHLIVRVEIDGDMKRQILEAMLEKCRSRDIEPDRHSLDNSETRRRSEADWNSLGLELGDLPEFGQCFERVRRFYRSLPWTTVA